MNSTELRDAVAASIEQSLYALALSGTDLRALDGVTVSSDARKAACELQSLPDGAVPLEMSDQPETMELARTVAVRREGEFRFHIVLRAGLGLMTLSAKPEEQALACGCLAHEAAHENMKDISTKPFRISMAVRLTAGDRSRQTFIKALDVWSEYAACRSSAEYRPEALGISKGHFASHSMEAAQHPEGGSRVSETAEERQIRSEKSNKPSGTRLSVPAICSAISTDWNCMNPKKELPRDNFSRRTLH